MIQTLLIALATVAQAPESSKDFPLQDGMRVVFLSDSITNYGLSIQYFEAYLLTRFPDRKVEVINLGLSGQANTDSGRPGSHPGTMISPSSGGYRPAS